MPFISVIATSTRVGGLDVTFSSLQLQTFKDFELILVDALYDHRKDLVAQKSKEYSFKIKHISQPKTFATFGLAINLGVVNSEADFVLIIPDYTWLKSDCIEKHVDFHKNKENKKYALIGKFWDCDLPQVHKDFYRSYSPETPYYREDPNPFLQEEKKNYQNYLDDLNSGKLNKLMWSLFENPFDLNTDFKSFIISQDIKKELLSMGVVESKYCVFKNESYSVENILNVNGLNESMDNSHGWHDVDFAQRLYALTETRLYHNPDVLAFTINPRKIIYARSRTRGVFDNEAIWEKSKNNNFKDPINIYSLRKKRNEYLLKEQSSLVQVPMKIKYKKPLISIICPTMRIGGLDTIFNSLKNSSFKNFELILSDSLYPYRKDLVKEKTKDCQYSIKHIQPINDKFPIFSQASAMNSAIVQAEGDIILFTTDYRYFMPWTLQMHADFHQANPQENIGYAPGSKYLLPPAIKNGVPSYGRNENYETYVNDLKSGKLDEFMWSIFGDGLFDEPKDLSDWPEIDRLKIGYDPKTIIAKGAEVPHNQIFTQSESVKISAVLAVNGLNEAFDGCFNYVDAEFSMRLRSMLGLRWIGDNTNIIYRLTGGGGLMPVIAKGKLIQEAQDCAEEIYKKYENGSKDPVNAWSLHEIHSKNNSIIEYEVKMEGDTVKSKNRESVLDYFGRNVKIVNWHLIPGNNGVYDPWLDETDIRYRHWNSFTTGQVVIDVGGCFGLYTLPALVQGCRVITFEPNVEFANLITESVIMNNFSDRYQCYNTAIWNKNREFPKELAAPLMQWSKKDGSLEITTLDDVAQNLNRVDMVKIDVEGGEAGVLEGAHEMIKKHYPSFLIEDHTQIINYSDIHNTRGVVIDILLSYGYTITTDLLPPPPPQGGRWFIIAHHPNKNKV